MVKNFLVKLLVAAIFLALFSLRFVDVTIGEKLYEYPLETAWKATGLPLTEVDTETWLKLNNQWQSITQLKNFGTQLRSKLNLRLQTDLTTGEQAEYTYISFEGIRSDQTVMAITIQSTRTENSVETQLGINTIHQRPLANLRNYVEQIKSQVSSLGVEPRFSVILQGVYPGKISELLAKEIAGKAFQRINAKLVQAGYENNNSCQKGYTELLTDSITIGSQPINLEISTRYNEAANTTEVEIGTPNLTDGD